MLEIPHLQTLTGRIMVTGAKGFLGSYLVDLLCNDPWMRTMMHAGVIQSIHMPFPPSKGGLDLRDPNATLLYFHEHKPDVIFHLAATVGGIGFNQDRPGTIFYNNMMMGLNVIEAARRVNVKKVIVVGTVCSYPKAPPVPFIEERLWDGYPEETNAPYGIAKKALMVMGQAYRNEYGLNVIHLIPTNLYGPKDDFNPYSSHVIPAMISKIVDAQARGEDEVEFWGDGKASREFLHAKDCATALMLAAERYNDPAPMNLGSGTEVRMDVLASMIARLADWQGVIKWNSDRPNGQPRRLVSTKRAWAALGWQAEVPLEQGLHDTIEWWRKEGGYL